MNRLWVAAVGEVEEALVEAMAERVAEVFAVEVGRAPDLAEPGYAWDAERAQYGAVPILRAVAAACPRGGEKLLAVTERDLFIPMLSFVYGQAQLGGGAALVSLARLRQEHYGLPANPALLRARARKEALHELGHTFGLVHCEYAGCAMTLATNIRQLDSKGEALCRSCGEGARRARAVHA